VSAKILNGPRNILDAGELARQGHQLRGFERPGEAGEDFRVTAQDEIELVLRQYVQHHGLSGLAQKMRRKAKRTILARGSFAIMIMLTPRRQSMFGKPRVRIMLLGPQLGGSSDAATCRQLRSRQENVRAPLVNIGQ
jgi:hypothetical protein